MIQRRPFGARRHLTTGGTRTREIRRTAWPGEVTRPYPVHVLAHAPAGVDPLGRHLGQPHGQVVARPCSDQERTPRAGVAALRSVEVGIAIAIASQPCLRRRWRASSLSSPAGLTRIEAG
jgi:hypothetical protein